MTVKRKAANSYDLTVNTKYSFKDFNVKDKVDVQTFKEYDLVKERKQTLTFQYSGGSCSGTVKSRFYKPVDGNNWVPSRTGAIACSVKRG